MSQTAIEDNQDQAPFAGVLINATLIATGVQAEASSEIPFGVMVQGGLATAEDSVLILAGASPVDVIGMLLHSHRYAKPGEVGDTGVKPLAMLSLLRKGTLWVIAEDAIDQTDEVHVRHTAGGGGAVLGLCRSAAVAAETFDVSTFCSWRSTAGAGELAQLEVDFTGGVPVADV